ncbi:hypothetical protein RYA05_01920 [Pseudomonas syringae pv. actinidiae]|nr:hypothetical protein [Pseudomonas syringae pv. actinidiae]
MTHSRQTLCKLALEVIDSYEDSMRSHAKVFCPLHVSLELSMALDYIKAELTVGQDQRILGDFPEIVARLIILGSDMTHEHYPKLMLMLVSQTHLPWPKGMIDAANFLQQLQEGVLFKLQSMPMGITALDFWYEGEALSERDFLRHLKTLAPEFENTGQYSWAA